MFNSKSVLCVILLWLLPALASAAPIAVSSIGVSGSTVTVTTATTHPYTVNQGVCLTSTTSFGSAGACGVVTTVPSGTTFTFAFTGAAACASSCDTVDAAMQAIVLGAGSDSSHQNVTYLCWKTTVNPVPKSGATSAWTATAGSRGASTAENNAIAAGNFIEEVVFTPFPSSFSGAQMETFVQNECASRQSAFAGETQPAAYFGFTFNGSTWVRQ